MSAPRSVRCLRQAVRSLSTRPVAPRYLPRQAFCASQVAPRSFASSSRTFKGILPDTDEPTLKESEPLHEINDPTPIPVEEYHERADHYLEELVSRAEELAEEKEGVDVEFSVSFGPRHNSLRMLTSHQGWCPLHHLPSQRHLRYQQATSNQANLAELPH